VFMEQFLLKKGVKNNRCPKMISIQEKAEVLKNKTILFL